MNAPKHRSISLSSSIVEAVEDYIKKNPQYRSIAAFFEEAARIKLQELKVKA
jgi:hypothetical protein